MARAFRAPFAFLIAASILISCAGTPALPSLELPSFDTTAIEELVAEAVAEIERVAASPPSVELPPIELPPDLRRLLDERNIALPPLPSNATEICTALGTPVGTAASAGMSTLVQHLIIGGEVGIVVGLLVTVVARTCPAWVPHLETAVDQLL